MNNAKLSTKLLLLTILLLSMTVLIAWIGVSRLAVLDAKVQQLGDQTHQEDHRGWRNSGQTSDVHSCAEECDSVTDRCGVDQRSGCFAKIPDRSEPGNSLTGGLLTRWNERSLLDTFEEAFAEIKKVNDECLVLAVQNTNLKGAPNCTAARMNRQKEFSKR